MLHFADRPLECIHNQDTVLWTVSLCLWIFCPWFVTLVWCDCHHCVLKWLTCCFFYQVKYLGAVDEKESFGYIMQALYRSWNCNNDSNGVPLICLGRGMFCQDWHLAVLFGSVVELVWNVEVSLSFPGEELGLSPFKYGPSWTYILM